ncbi:MAG TPA: hypothetical protein VK453_03395 [Micromonosporaceae bacterium]|nr:hypothetical protein [Micromonosporaceae bacterium]
METSGSLTGHILSQGSADNRPATRSGTGKVVLVLVLILLVVAALVAVGFANTRLLEVIKDVISG